jgi:hypothetical protein
MQFLVDGMAIFMNKDINTYVNKIILPGLKSEDFVL